MNPRHPRRLLTLAACVLLCMGRAAAWEFEDAVPLPQPSVGARPDQVVLQHAALSLRGMSLNLRYEWSNLGAAVDADLAIYLPLFDWQGAAAEYGDRHFPELSVQQDGRRLLVRRDTRAVHGGREITSLLRQGRINPLLVADNEVLTQATSSRHRQVWRELVRMGAAHELDGMYMPDWFAQATPFWRMHWPEKQPTVMALSYKARPAFAPWESNDAHVDALLAAHCSSRDRLKADFDAHHWPWPAYMVLQRFELPLGVRSWHVDQVDIDFDPGAQWSGLKPSIAYMCTASGELLSGSPAIVKPAVRVQEDRLSILVVLPQ